MNPTIAGISPKGITRPCRQLVAGAVAVPVTLRSCYWFLGFFQVRVLEGPQTTVEWSTGVESDLGPIPTLFLRAEWSTGVGEAERSGAAAPYVRCTA